MPKPKLIPSDREPEILARVGSGESTESIAEWLSGVLGRRVDGRRVRDLLERIRKERAPIAKAVVAAKLGKTLTTDLDSLSDALARAVEDERAARLGYADLDAGSPEWARCLSAASSARGDLLRGHELRFRLSGATDGAADDVDAVRARLLAKLDAAADP